MKADWIRRGSRGWSCLALLLLSFALVPGLHAAEPPARGPQATGDAVQLMSVRVAPTVTPDQASTPEAPSRQDTPALWPSHAGSLNFGLTPGRVRIALQLRQHETTQEPWVLLVRNPSLKELRLSAPWPVDQANPPAMRWTLGRDLPVKQRPIRDRHFAMPLEWPATPGDFWLLLEADSDLGLKLPVELLPLLQYAEELRRDNLLQGLYFGLMLTMAIISLFIGLSLRERVYLLYTAFLLAVGLWIATRLGIAYETLWPRSPGWNGQAHALLMILGAGLSVLFTRDYLQSGTRLPRLDPWLKGLAGAWATLLVVSPWLTLNQAFTVSALLLIPGGSLLLWTGFIAWRRGEPQAGSYLAAWLVMIVGAMILMGTYLGWLPMTDWTETLFQIGSAVEGIILSTALARRLKAQWLARNQALELTVQARTRELEEAMNQLSTANAELQRLSRTDPLTGLPNRRKFESDLATLWELARREQVPLSLILIDLDHFKQINDQYGHHAGDRCLQAIARRLEHEASRASDRIARYGGEELLVLSYNTSAPQARLLAERLREAIAEERIALGPQTLQVTASLGVASRIPGEDDAPGALFEEADRRLYRAKAEGRNRVTAGADDQATPSPPPRPAASG